MLQTIPHSSWLYPEEQSEVVSRLLEGGLLKFDNDRSLPLKSGGTTDVYINLRDARNDPKDIEFITGLYEHPLRRLEVSRFLEVPDAVSCFAGLLSTRLGVPYLTIRPRPKEGRAGDSKIIGHARRGERVCIFDDVITDGASKMPAYGHGVRLGLDNRALVVLVDRQQGWQQHFAEKGIELHVWPGMTLHDVRRHLIQTLGVMQRCDPAIEEKNPLIVALDGKRWEQVLPVIDQLRTTGCILKGNDIIFNEGLRHLVPNLSVYGRVMVDLKGHDIPNTVKNIMAHVRPHQVWAVTVHASGNEAMVKAAVEALKGTQTKVLAVTVLTSIDPTCEEIFQRWPMEQVKVLAAIAYRAGAHGLVCSPEEARTLRALYPKMTLVTPGIRSAGVDAGDQRRTATPAGAIQNGSNHLVMGRQIFGAADPVAEVKRVLSEEIPTSA